MNIVIKYHSCKSFRDTWIITKKYDFRGNRTFRRRHYDECFRREEAWGWSIKKRSCWKTRYIKFSSSCHCASICISLCEAYRLTKIRTFFFFFFFGVRQFLCNAQVNLKATWLNKLYLSFFVIYINWIRQWMCRLSRLSRHNVLFVRDVILFGKIGLSYMHGNWFSWKKLSWHAIIKEHYIFLIYLQ